MSFNNIQGRIVTTSWRKHTNHRRRERGLGGSSPDLLLSVVHVIRSSTLSV